LTQLRSHAAAALAIVLVVVGFCAASASSRRIVLGVGPRLEGATRGFSPWKIRQDHTIVRLVGDHAFLRLPLVLIGPVNVGLTLRSTGGRREVQFRVGAESLGSVPVKGSEVHALFLSQGSARGFQLDLAVRGGRPGPRQVAVRELTLSPQGGVVLPAATVVLVLATSLLLSFWLFLALGVSLRAATLLVVAGLGLPACVLSALDPHAAAALVLRMLWWLPLLGGLAALGLRALARHVALDAPARALGVTMVLLALLVRGGFLFHPDHYFKDVPIHNRITQFGVERGIGELWRNIERYQLKYDLGTTYVHKGLRVIRYPMAYYTLAVVPARLQEALGGGLDVDYWNRVVAASAAALQALPTFLILLYLWPHRSAAIAGTLLAIFSPLDIHELVNVSYPATLGKLADLTLACYLILAARRAGSWRWTAGVFLLLTGCLLTYPATWTNMGVCLAFYLALLVAWREPRAALRLLIAGVAAVTGAHLAFYGDLIVRLLTSHAPAGFAQDSPASHVGELLSPGSWLWGAVGKWFTGFHVVALLAGLVLVLRSAVPRAAKAFVLAWLLAIPTLLAIFLMARVIFAYIRPFYFASTLLAVLGGVALAWLQGSGIRAARTLAVLGLALLLETQIARLSDFAPGFYRDYHGMVPQFSLWRD
jgi:hypothetical protein